jgi:iron uptake system component EfeO
LRRWSIAILLAAVATVAGCASPAPVSSASSAHNGPIDVRADDTDCALSTADAPAGTLTFNVTNTGAEVTDFYFYSAADHVMGEVENIGPGLTRQLIVEVPDGGIYTTVCKPEDDGDGIRTPFTVTGSAARSVDTNAKLAEATAGYKRYVTAQVAELAPKTREFADAVKAGDVERAKALYPVTRTHWERIEPIGESFEDIDSRMDGREDDKREPGEAFTGFHRLEKDLWADGLRPDSPAIGDRLVADVDDLQTRLPDVELTPLQLANGAKELLDEVAISKLGGEEERYSHTDLWDIAANVAGSRALVAALRPVISDKDPKLALLLDEQFGDMDRVLEGQRVGEGFRPYKELSQYDIKRMAITVDTLNASVRKVAQTITP